MFNFGNIAELMKQVKNMQENVEKAKQELKNEKIIVEVGGGMLKVTVNGLGEIIDLEIDDTLLQDKELLKDLLLSGINEAQNRAKEEMAEKMQKAAGLPGGLGGLSNLF